MTTDAIRDRVMRAIALNREPGYHFAGNFLDISYDRVTAPEVTLSLMADTHCTDRLGNVDTGVLAFFADLSLAAGVRASLDNIERLATVSLDLRFTGFTGLPGRSRLEAIASFEGCRDVGPERLGMSRVTIGAAGRRVCFGTGAFMALRPAKPVGPHPMMKPSTAGLVVPQFAEHELAPDELQILRRAEAAIEAARSGDEAFLAHFWDYRPRRVEGGASSEMHNEPHVRNRVGHVQGGILLGLAAATAAVILPLDWSVAGLSAWYLRAAEGTLLRATSRPIHAGRLTAVIRTQVIGKNRQRVLEVVSSHAARARDDR